MLKIHHLEDFDQDILAPIQFFPIMASMPGSATSSKPNKSHFWKKDKAVPGSIQKVYGAQYPPSHVLSSLPQSPTKKDKPHDSFQNFQERTNDAWSIDEIDDDEEYNVVLKTAVNTDIVESTAMQVLNMHSLQQAKEKIERAQHNALHRQGQGASPQQSPPSAFPREAPGIGVRLSQPSTVRKTVLQYNTSPVKERELLKSDKFKTLLANQNIDLEQLRTLSWSGIPKQYRPWAWKLLSGYLPPNVERQKPTLIRKRQEYFSFIDQYFDTRHTDLHKDTFRQIAIDIPRMNPLIPIFQQKSVQTIFERILYIWAIRHPASGYVQGINDLVTPFFVVFLSEYISNDVELEDFDLSALPLESRETLEADCFWCFSKLLDGIQDNYTFAQPGIQKKIKELETHISRIDHKLHEHLSTHHVEYLQFSFRWMNNLLMREMPLRCIIRLWDTCLSENDGFSSFYLYICTSFLINFSVDLLRENDFQGILILLQNLPTHRWDDDEIGLLVAEAFKLKYMFADAPNHLHRKS